jgi:hypothetical protein
LVMLAEAGARQESAVLPPILSQQVSPHR